jgi:hypothetical protein
VMTAAARSGRCIMGSSDKCLAVYMSMMIHDDSDVHDDYPDVNVAPTLLGPVSLLQ